MTEIKKRNSSLSRISPSDRAFNIINTCFFLFYLTIIIYPLWIVVMASVSDPDAVFQGEVFWRPVNPSLMGYQAISNFTLLWRSYLNSIVYTISYTIVAVFITLAAAFALINQFPGRKAFNWYFVLTMFFSGGLIPTFLLMNTIGLFNNPLIMVLMGTVSVWNLMIARTYISGNIPKELYESAHMDGASYFYIFFRIVLPLSSTIVAVLCIFFAVGRWNDFFMGLVYIRNRSWLPLQTVLREIVVTLSIDTAMITEMVPDDDMTFVRDKARIAEVAKYCAIVLSTGPAVILFVTMQDYFRKGVMIGSIKG